MTSTYFILAPQTGLVKIGRSDDPDSRLNELQVGSPEVLELILILDHRAPFEERQLHFRFAKYRRHGEWFEFRDELECFIREHRVAPLPTRADDEALGQTDDEGRRIPLYRHARHDNRTPHNPEDYDTDENCRFPQTLMRSPGYGVSPIWNSDSTSQEFWHQVSTWRR